MKIRFYFGTNECIMKNNEMESIKFEKSKGMLPMKSAYIAVKYYEDYRNKDLINAIDSALKNKDYRTYCIIRDEEEGGKIKLDSKKLMRIAFSKIEKSDLVVIDLTEKGVGIGIEAGYAFAKGIPIITIAKQGSDISNTLEGISEKIFYYEAIGDIGKILDINN